MEPKLEKLLKVDGVGRVWTPRELREGALDEFERCGMPGTQFAARLGGEVFDVCFVGAKAAARAGGAYKMLEWISRQLPRHRAARLRILRHHGRGRAGCDDPFRASGWRI